MLTLFFSIFASLFSVVNPLGAVPVFLGMTPDYTDIERRQTARNTSVYFVLILLAFFLLGTYILEFFGISLDAMRIAGGLVIFASGYSMLSGKLAEGRAVGDKVKAEALIKEDISFAPMAMPMLSGPGSISLLIGLYAEHALLSQRFLVGAVIVSMGLTVYFILKLSPRLFKIMGVAGMKAVSRIMGFIVMTIGVQYMIVGIVSLVHSVLNP